MNISRTSELLADARECREDLARQIESGPESLAKTLSLASLDANIEELQEQLTREKSDRNVEVMEIRLSGPVARHGRLPLEVLGGLSNQVAGFLHATASRIHVGVEPRGRIREEVKQTLDLNFGGVAPGSTRIFIVGKTNPDLLGRSLLEETLTNTFSLLADYYEDKALMERVHAIGNRGARKLTKLLHGLQKYNLDATVSWRNPEGAAYEWLGTAESIQELSESLERISYRSTEAVNLVGSVHLISMSGRLELHSDDGERIRSEFPKTLLPAVKELHVGQRITGQFEKTAITNLATGDIKEYYTLQEVQG